MGITPSEFWANSWKENQLLAEAYTIKHNFEWERIRYLATMIHNVNVGKKQHMIKPEKLFELPQDRYHRKNKVVEILSPEQVKRIAANFGKTQKSENH